MPRGARSERELEDRPRVQQYGARKVSNLVGVYRIHPPHGFEPGWASDSPSTPLGARSQRGLEDGPRSNRWSSGVETRHRIMVGISFAYIIFNVGRGVSHTPAACIR